MMKLLTTCTLRYNLNTEIFVPTKLRLIIRHLKSDSLRWFPLLDTLLLIWELLYILNLFQVEQNLLKLVI